MNCNKCGNGKSEVLESRKNTNGTIRRRRKCLDCGNRYTTIEINYDTIKGNDLVLVPKRQLKVLEQKRKDLFTFLKRYKLDGDTFVMCDILDITEVMWELGNRKYKKLSDINKGVKNDQ